MKKLLTLFPVLLASASLAYAELKVDPIYQSHMVLQQGVQVPVSGTCSGSEPVTVSFGDQQVQARVEEGKWLAELSPMKASSTGRKLSVEQGAERVTLEDVLVGEVWVASGQSNMLWRMDQTRDTESMGKAALPLLRYYHAEPQVHTSKPVYTEKLRQALRAGNMYKGAWSVSSPETCKRMSAVAWYFGRELQKKLGVPVGIIHASLGGSEMLAWMPRAVLESKYPDALSSQWLESPYVSAWVRQRGRENIGDELDLPHPFKPGFLFETGIAPWVKYPVAGVIWYQGESDAEIQDQEQNRSLLTELITGWRTEFKRPELPFIMVQLPRINDPSPLRAYWPEFRAVQQQVADTLPKVFSCVTIDLGSTNRDVHPPRKLEVGERMAAVAAARVYGKKGEYSGPVIKSAQLKGKKVALSFTHAKQLRTVNKAAPTGFELSMDGTTFYPATAELKGNTVLLSSSEVKAPKHVRYAWAVFLEPNLVNEVGLPTAPFTISIGAH